LIIDQTTPLFQSWQHQPDSLT